MPDPDVLADRDELEGTWNVDPRGSEVGFAARNFWGLQTVRGVFTTCGGSLRVGPGQTEGELVIDADSVETGNRKRDEHLRSPDFFDVEQHPQIVFAARNLAAGEGGLVVSGQLSIGAEQLELSVPVRLQPAADGSLALAGSTTISRTRAGISWNRLGTIGDPVELHAKLSLTPGR